MSTTPGGFASWEAAVDYMRALRPSVSEAARQQRLKHMLKPAADGGYTWRYDHEGIAQVRLNPDPARVPDLVAATADVQCQALVLRGGRSDYLQPHMTDHMQALNSRFRAVEIPDAGHYIHDDQPALFARAVTDFLAAPDA
jgi:pimeloyl-ACP methyl ester carboxylesterase